jgi:hypothetical protein
MRTFYRAHSIEVNTLPSGTILFDIFNRSRQPLLTGFSLTDPNEQTVMDRMRERVDQIILDPPVRMGMRLA